MKTRMRIWSAPAISFLGLALFLAPGANAQQPGPDGNAPQPNPDMRAARLSYVEGEVQLTQGGQLLADPALVNTPLFEGAEVTTKDDGRAELQFDDGTVVRVSPNSSVKIAALGQQNGMGNAEIDLKSGLAYFEMPGDTSTDRVIARFSGTTVSTSGFTVLRIDDDNPPGELAVFNGNAHLERASGLSLDMHGGESIALNDNDPNQYNLAETIEPNSWDAWNADRDQELSAEQSAKTAATGSQPDSSNPAWGDLDANGQWYNVPDQGYVWSPYEAASGNWDPYGCGSWVWNPQFGYSWVSCESWGYLPYTCGYWNFYDGFGWGWTPGFGYPWWTTGGWVGNVGRRPARWEPPHRPHGGPIHPPGGPARHGGLYQPNPVIAVNRIPKSPVANPVHVVGRPVTIAGSTVEPMRPLSPRPVYNHTTSSNIGRGFAGSGNPGYTVFPRPGNPSNGYAGRPGYAPVNPGRPGAWPAPAPGGTYRAPAPPAGGVYRAPIAPAPRSFSGGASYSNHAYSGGSRPSGGGGGHVSSGGGGHVGGGGGGHVSAGGGGHASGGGHH